MEEISKILKVKMVEKNISANALEKLAGLKPSVVQNILQGKSKNPTIHTLQAISQVLGCTLEELILNSPIQPWDGKLYEEAVSVTNDMLSKEKLGPNKKQATHFIDELYSNALFNNSAIDLNYAKQLFAKLFLKI